MLLSKEVEVKWSTRNKEHYIALGYHFTKLGDDFIARVADLTKGSVCVVKIKCDKCGEEKNIVYKDLIRSKSFKEDKYLCKKCINHNHYKPHNAKKRNSLWANKEYRLKLVDNYIKKHGKILGMGTNKEGHNIYNNVILYGDTVKSLAIELGYDLDVVYPEKYSGYYNDIDNIKNELQNFINEYGHFPTQTEMVKIIKLDSKVISKLGGVYELKKLMKITDDDLIDDNGWFNRSRYEWYVAQFLINVLKITYKREQSPFNNPYKKYKSDFTLYPKNKKPIHIEVWGFHKDKDKNNNTWNELYDKKMIKKKKLYDENNIELIEIFSKDFDNLSYEQINKNLLNIFKEYRNEHFECVDLNIYVDARKNTNDELFNICMELSTIDNVIPPSTTFRDMNLRCIYEEIIKRFGNIKNFAKEYNVKTTNEYRSEQKLLRKKNKAI